jgi:hypothetical protein
MSDFKKLAEAALRKANKSTTLNEGVVYPEGMSERMHPKLEQDLLERKHSLGKHPIFPEGDESNFEQKIMGERFSEVVKRYKRAFDTDTFDTKQILTGMAPIVHETMSLERNHKKALEKLAEKMIREEFDMGKDVVEIHAELTETINMEGTKKHPTPMATKTEFKNHDEMVSANEEVYKRRFLNAMTQGAAKKCNHMFHMVDNELTELDPRLPNKYSKMMAAADSAYYLIPNLENKINAGIVRVQFPNKDNPKAVIYAQAMVFPVLIHELVKGVMELLSAHGLPKKKSIGQYVINKADFLEAEPWDMRLGPGLWERFTHLIEAEDFKLKHHVYSELAALPVKEFNIEMREIMAGTKEGKKIIKTIMDEVKKGLQEDEFNEAMKGVSNKNLEQKNDEEGFDYGDLFGDEPNNNPDTQTDGFDFEELF